MRLDVEARKAIQDASSADVIRALRALRSFGPHSFAILTSGDGSYIQVAGGGQTCAIEVRNASNGRQYRACQFEPHPLFPDGTLLAFGAGKLVLQGDEWFTAGQAATVLIEFLGGAVLPTSVPSWRDVTELMSMSR